MSKSVSDVKKVNNLIKMKGFKICLDGNRGIKKGIAANTLEDLKAKIAIKFEVRAEYSIDRKSVICN